MPARTSTARAYSPTPASYPRRVVITALTTLVLALGALDIPTLGALGTILIGIIGAIVTIRRLPGQERSEAVNTHHTILGDMKLLNDTLVAECARLREREEELVEELAVERTNGRDLKQELIECRARRERLEAELERLGLETP